MFRRSSGIARSQELVFLDPDDDLGTVRSKLESTTAEEVYLVVPRRSPVLRTPLELRILARIANELSAETIIVTSDGARRRWAHAEGFRTRRSLRTLRHLLLAEGERPPWFVIPDWVPLPSLGSFVTPLVLALLVLGVLAVVLPVMRVTLIPQTTPVSSTLEITVDPAVRSADVPRGILPGDALTTRFEVSGALRIPANRPLGQDRARGEVLIVSQRDDTVILPRGAIVRVPNGPRFQTDIDVRLAPQVPGRAGVTAVDPGAAGNVPAGAISAFDGPGMERVQVSNQRATTGGTDRLGRVVTLGDQVQLKEELVKQAEDRATTDLRARSGDERSLPGQTIKLRVEEERFDQQPGAEAEQITGRVTVSATGTAFRNVGFNDLVAAMLGQRAGTDVRPIGSLEVSPPQLVAMEDNKLKLRTQGTATFVGVFEPAAIQESLRGKTVEEARAQLARLSGLAQTPRVDMQPAWAPRALRVEVAVQNPR